MDPERWANRSPGDLSVELPEIVATDAGEAVARSQAVADEWRRTPLADRITGLRNAQIGLRDAAESLARGIAIETGKALREARLEVGAVIAKIDLTLADAGRWLADEHPSDNPHPSLIRRIPRGPAAVIAPFNFPLHLGHGAAVAYLLAGNPVLFKPSPMAASVAEAYGQIMAAVFPGGVFQLVQGWGETGRRLAIDARVRSVCFTGSVAAGRALARELADDFSKDLALELGGKNATIVRADADLDLAAAAVADAACLTCGQRCNSTSRVIVDRAVLGPFVDRLTAQLARFVPGDPMNEATWLGPLVSDAAVRRYAEATAPSGLGEWVVPGRVEEFVQGRHGYYVHPAVLVAEGRSGLPGSALWQREWFAPVLAVVGSDNDDDVLGLHNAGGFGLTTSVFTRSEPAFRALTDRLQVGNVYANLPTTFSPSTLPFGGLGESGNRHPGGRGFVRFTTDEQAVQWLKEGFAP